MAAGRDDTATNCRCQVIRSVSNWSAGCPEPEQSIYKAPLSLPPLTGNAAAHISSSLCAPACCRLVGGSQAYLTAIKRAKHFIYIENQVRPLSSFRLIDLNCGSRGFSHTIPLTSPPNSNRVHQYFISSINRIRPKNRIADALYQRYQRMALRLSPPTAMRCPISGGGSASLSEWWVIGSRAGFASP
jgi:phosphatidylserine/phosphatidylglycerophosphate/cardiolipin synthase-like enzyme